MDYTDASNAVLVHGDKGYADCKTGVEGTFITANALNAVQSEIMNFIVKSGQTPIPFDADDPASYDQLWRGCLQTLTSLIPDIPDIPEFVQSPAGFSRRAVYTSNATWVAPSNISSALVIVIGAGRGGSGGRGNVSPANNSVGHVSGGGGGGGGFAQELITAITPGQSIPVIIGSGGLGAQYGLSANSTGGNGGVSSFGAFLSASGGKGASNQRGGGGGSTSGADVSFSLGAGGFAELTGDAQGKGGHGGGGTAGNGTGSVNGSPGANASIVGGGGGGASYGGGVGAKGGNGFRGQVTIYY
ncbi:MAG: hypothetical protein JKX81_17585 [Arenicella sp.]|nr:hypothetical protein [Arenicella sp.]